MSRPSPKAFVADLGPRGRDVLLRVLTASEKQRAAVIGKVRAVEGGYLTEVLILLEEERRGAAGGHRARA